MSVDPDACTEATAVNETATCGGEKGNLVMYQAPVPNENGFRVQVPKAGDVCRILSSKKSGAVEEDEEERKREEKEKNS